MHAPASALLALAVAATSITGSAVATADGATTAKRFYRDCPKVTKQLYPAPPNLVSSSCKRGAYYERLRVVDSSWSASPDGTVTSTAATTHVVTVKRGPAAAAPAKPVPAVA